jgi:GNAT superfamily N-acetyltransferase
VTGEDGSFDDPGVATCEIRRAEGADANGLADVWLESFKATYPFPPAHPDADVRRWLRDELMVRDETWVAVDGDGTVVALMALGADELDQLYVRPGRQGQGLGSRLVELAKVRRPHGLALYTFQVNARARAFYEKRGFTIDRLGAGDHNEEHQPDVRYVWQPETSDEAGTGRR